MRKSNYGRRMSMTSTGNYPTQYESRLTLKNGMDVFIRPIMETDEKLMVDLFNRLSPQSVYLRFLMHLHALPKDMLYRLLHVNYSTEFALAAIIDEDGKDAIIAIARYGYSPDESLADLAVAVRDDWQHLGLGKLLLKKVVDIGREHGIRRFGGMMEPDNKIMRQILVELGYKTNYVLRSGFYQVEIST
jgi:GNAT superfamily N-acetyltransferase